MANKEISELTNKAAPVGSDEIEIQESGGGASKKTTLQAVWDEISTSSVDINGGAIDGTPIGATTPAAANVTTLSASSTGLITGDLGVGASRSSTTGFSKTLNIEGADTSLQIYNTTTSTAWEIGNDNTGLFRVLEDGTNKLTIDTSGNVAVSGNAEFSSGNGIDFSATSDASGMTSELLDDYEEGTWTIGITPASGSGVTFGSRTGTYTKIGNRVSWECNYTLTSKGTASGSMLHTGLPFTTGAQLFPIYCGHATNMNTVAGRNITGTTNGGATSFYPYEWDSTSGSTIITDSSFTSTSSLYFGGHYYV